VWTRSEAAVYRIAEEAHDTFPGVDPQGYRAGLRQLFGGAAATLQAGAPSTAVALVQKAIHDGVTGGGAMPRDFPVADGRTVSREAFDQQLRLFCA
jgi:hypothetical protein